MASQARCEGLKKLEVHWKANDQSVSENKHIIRVQIKKIQTIIQM
jgi:hypothetical protein